MRTWQIEFVAKPWQSMIVVQILWSVSLHAKFLDIPVCYTENSIIRKADKNGWWPIENKCSAWMLVVEITRFGNITRFSVTDSQFPLNCLSQTLATLLLYSFRFDGWLCFRFKHKLTIFTAHTMKTSVDGCSRGLALYAACVRYLFAESTYGVDPKKCV